VKRNYVLYREYWAKHGAISGTVGILARPGRSRKGGLRAVRTRRGGRTILALFGTERPDCGERGMGVSGGIDPET
jgi:hypothetical protein